MDILHFFKISQLWIAMFDSSDKSIRRYMVTYITDLPQSLRATSLWFKPPAVEMALVIRCKRITQKVPSNWWHVVVGEMSFERSLTIVSVEKHAFAIPNTLCNTTPHATNILYIKIDHYQPSLTICSNHWPLLDHSSTTLRPQIFTYWSLQPTIPQPQWLVIITPYQN